MRVIIDGCDGVGKTTIVEKLANLLNCNIIRLTKNGSRTLSSYSYLMEANDVVHDRSFMSEIVYPKVFGKVSKLTDKQIKYLWDLIKEEDTKVFILSADFEEIKRRIEARGDEFIDDLSTLKTINDEYLHIAEEHDFVVIDTTNKSVDEILNEIMKHLKN